MRQTHLRLFDSGSNQSRLILASGGGQSAKFELFEPSVKSGFLCSQFRLSDIYARVCVCVLINALRPFLHVPCPVSDESLHVYYQATLMQQS